jgi:hypothetical protein
MDSSQSETESAWFLDSEKGDERNVVYYFCVVLSYGASTGWKCMDSASSMVRLCFVAHVRDNSSLVVMCGWMRHEC